MKTSSLPLIPPLLLLALTVLESRRETGDAPFTRWTETASAGIITFQDLDAALLPAVEGGPVDFPDWLEALDGKRVTVAGFMAPFDQLDDLSVFMLMPSYVGFYFCAPPSFTQVVLVRQQETTRRKKRPFIDPAIHVTGVLRLYRPGSEHPAHRDQFVYALDDAICEILSNDAAPQRAPAHGNKSMMLARSTDTAPTQDPNQPHQAFQPQLMVPAVSALRGVPLVGDLRFVKAPSDEIVRRLRLELERELPAPQRELMGRAFAQLNWTAPSSNWLDAMAGYEADRRAGLVSPTGNRVIYHDELALSKPAGRLAMAGLIYEALLRQNHPAFFEASHTVDAWVTLRALRDGDLAVLKADYVRRNWLSTPKPLPPLPQTEPRELLTAPLQHLLGLVEQTGESFVRQSRDREAHGFLEALYQKPPSSFGHYWLNDLAPPQTSPQGLPSPPGREGHILVETRLGAAALFTWLGVGRDAGETRELLSQLQQDRAAFIRPQTGGQELFVWETVWADELAATAFQREAEQTAQRQPLPQGAERMQVLRPASQPRTVLLQMSAYSPSALSFDTRPQPHTSSHQDSK